MFTDIVGYTAIMGKDEDRAVDMLTKNHVIHKTCIEKFKGSLIKEIGDGILASFSLASEAVRCAIEIQNACMKQEIPLKIGIHEGETLFARGDVLGDTVNVAARLLETSKEGCIFVSDTVYKNIKNKADIRVKFVEERSLKNVEELLKIYNVSCKAFTSGIIKPTSVESGPEKKKSIIVLPFDDMSPESDQEYFSDGLTEEIITDLSHINDLLVISRSSAMTYKGTKKKVKKIAKEVDVQYVLEGSVRKAENNLRITAQLVDGLNDTHLWAEKYGGTLDDIFQIQEDVSRSIVEALKLKLSPDEETKLIERPIDDPLAIDCYMKASYEIMRFTESSIDRALEYLQNGQDIVGENPHILAGMGLAHFQYVNLGMQQEEHLEKAEMYARKALQIDPDSAQAHFTMGLIYYLKKNLRKATSHVNKSLSVNPNNIDALGWAGFYYFLFGKINKAKLLTERSIKLDPLNVGNPLLMGCVPFFEGKYESAIPFLFKTYKMAPDIPMYQFWYALSLAYVQRYEDVISVVDMSLKSPNQDIMTQLSHFLKLAIQGDIDGISGLLTEDFVTTCKRDMQLSYHIATFYTLVDQTENAFEWLENAVDGGFINYPYLNSIDPFLENIRGEEQFKKLMERVRYEWENFEF
jgi:TolB-like protein